MGVLRDHPELALFLCLAAGYLLGKLRVGPITLGGICGTLIVSLLLGAWSKVVVSDDVKTIFFALFIFSLGYLAGPQFFANLNRESLRFFALCLIEVVCVVGIALGLAKGFDLDVGTAAGILAGAATESAVVGTATEAIGKLSDLTQQQIAQYQGHVATAYTVCYLFGLVTIVIYTSQIMPMMMRIDLREASRALWEKMRGGSGGLDSDEREALPNMVGRTFLVTHADGVSVGEVERSLGGRVTVESVKRGSKVLTPPPPDFELTLSDLVLAVGRRAQVIGAWRVIGPETPAVPGLDTPLATTQVSLTDRGAVGKSLDALSKEHPEFASGGVYVTDVLRNDQHLPATPETVVARGDVLTLVGARSGLGRLASKIGAVVKNDATDFIYLGLGIVCGSLLGQVVVRFGSVPMSLGTGGGCLISGLLFGWFRSRTQTFGAFPPQAATTLKDMGLAIFIACTGLVSGPQAWPLLKEYGALLPFAGIAMVLVPATLSLFVGRKLLRIEKPLLIGAIAGQQCSTPAITSITQVAQSSVPMLGYTVTYTLSNFLLPLTGPLLVGILGA
ncbi:MULTISPECIES: aspartate-alanine antiporter [unclassified Streptomyces]|uniref:aspartate-alanine antiporter n=1 Tax=unclassified Streptomyces TaxID=2593676 RepID=UPI001660FCFD|nr:MULTISPECIES: aspartate-alanine antiporter [unclassified Streptomyces]MBD0707869.1 aspartate-alanine antiporter [Streptomyces sp. CBMA291]MBD0717570.1 aspartate-alanine antiporter [Streptomyces sp. CBMA370]